MRDVNKLNSEGKLINISIKKYLPFWPLFAFLIAVALVSARFYIKYYSKPIYETSATLIIKDENKGVDDSKIIQQMNVFTSKKIVENEIEVISSRTLMKKVALELGLYASVFEDKGLKKVSAYTSSPIVIRVAEPQNIPLETGVFSKMYFRYDSAKAEVQFQNRSVKTGTWIATPCGSIMFTINTKKKETATGPLYFSLVNPSFAANDLLSRLNVSPANKLSTVVDLKFKDEVPQRGADVINQLINVYVQSSVNEKNALAASSIAFIEERMRLTEIELDEVEKEIEKYKATNGAVDLSEQGKLFLQSAGDNNGKISEVNLKLAVLDKVEKYVLSKSNNTSIVPATFGVNDPVLSNLLNKLYDAEIEYDKLRKTTAENNSIVVAVADEIKKIRPGILENVRNQQVNLRSTLATLTTTSARNNAILQKIPQKERSLLELNRKQAIKNNLFSFLLEKREEAALSHGPTAGDSRIVDLAEPAGSPIGANSKIIYMTAVAAAVGLGLCFISCIHFLQGTVLFRDEIEELTTYPIVGEVVAGKPDSFLEMVEGAGGIMAEQFRLLRTSLRYIGIRGSKKKVLFTSSVSGEGKSFIAANLGLSLAIANKKVVVVEFDLCRPTLARELQVEESKGVADFLNGEADPEEIIFQTKVNPNLFLVSAGAVVSNPSELILNSRTEELLDFLSKKFDYVLVDSAPVGILSDAYILSQFCDATLFIVRRNHTPKKLLKQLEKYENVGNFKKLCIVFNGVKTPGFFGGKFKFQNKYEYNKYAYSVQAKGGKRKKSETSYYLRNGSGI